ncbi:Hypothetical_protein [Hexamita inflata]|uniref:Hypothetical_protein n=1 Tax=Hexamita inflata TaxID=28002 RepID=A0AA86N7U9_9EUKA|nr:Hypothetical protein HINF_LOCUS2050 [Hexamita inflata]
MQVVYRSGLTDVMKRRTTFCLQSALGHFYLSSVSFIAYSRGPEIRERPSRRDEAGSRACIPGRGYTTADLPRLSRERETQKADCKEEDILMSLRYSKQFSLISMKPSYRKVLIPRINQKDITKSMPHIQLHQCSPRKLQVKTKYHQYTKLASTDSLQFHSNWIINQKLQELTYFISLKMFFLNSYLLATTFCWQQQLQKLKWLKQLQNAITICFFIFHTIFSFYKQIQQKFLLWWKQCKCCVTFRLICQQQQYMKISFQSPLPVSKNVRLLL